MKTNLAAFLLSQESIKCEILLQTSSENDTLDMSVKAKITNGAFKSWK